MARQKVQVARKVIQVETDVWSALKDVSRYYDKSISEVIRAMLKNGGTEILKKNPEFKPLKYKTAEEAIANL